MKVIVEKVSNGYVVTTDDGAVHIATEISSYSYSDTSVSAVLKKVFEKKEKAPTETTDDFTVTA